MVARGRLGHGEADERRFPRVVAGDVRERPMRVMGVLCAALAVVLAVSNHPAMAFASLQVRDIGRAAVPAEHTNGPFRPGDACQGFGSDGYGKARQETIYSWQALKRLPCEAVSLRPRDHTAAATGSPTGSRATLAGLVTQLRELPSGFYESAAGPLDSYHAAPRWLVSRQVLAAHHWVGAYEAAFQYSYTTVVSAVDRFHSAGDAHRWVRFFLDRLVGRLPKSFRPESLPRIGEESVAYAFVSAGARELDSQLILFRRGPYVGEITLESVPHPRQVSIALARHMDGRMRAAASSTAA